jgi:hypothetical protein
MNHDGIVADDGWTRVLVHRRDCPERSPTRTTPNRPVSHAQTFVDIFGGMVPHVLDEILRVPETDAADFARTRVVFNNQPLEKLELEAH